MGVILYDISTETEATVNAAGLLTARQLREKANKVLIEKARPKAQGILDACEMATREGKHQTPPINDSGDGKGDCQFANPEVMAFLKDVLGLTVMTYQPPPPVAQRFPPLGEGQPKQQQQQQTAPKRKGQQGQQQQPPPQQRGGEEDPPPPLTGVVAEKLEAASKEARPSYVVAW